MTRHLDACPARHEATTALNSQRGRKEFLYHLSVRDSWLTDFWLNLEVRGSATLQDVDEYLRAIWLECCGHLSQFYIKRWENEISMRRQMWQVFQPGAELTHIYDFGTSSETLVKAVSVREGRPTTSHPIALMARNDMPEVSCLECDLSASMFCMECLLAGDDYWTLCEEHAQSHPHDDYGRPMPLVNSPRLGLCGYDGPAEPPY